MGHTPYGYKIVKGRAVVDEEAADKLRLFYKNYLNGFALRSASETAGIHVTHGQAKRMLLNKKYLGTDYYPKIIDADTIEAVRNEIGKRAEKLGRIYEPKVKEKRTAAVKFVFEEEETVKFDNPYQQAEYMYSLIKEVT